MSMIAYLRGAILEKHPNQLILDAGGVGYDILIPVSTYTTLGEVGASASLRIHTHVREDALQLFGFATAEEKIVFERLIGVSGIGPKLAVTVLSGLPTAELIGAIRGGDVAKLVRIPGVGKKTAERMVLELKDKLTGAEAAVKGIAPSAVPAAGFSALEQDVLSALLNLGCARPAAEAAIRKVAQAESPHDFEPFFRTALAAIR